MLKKFTNRLRGFGKDTEGTLSVEAAIVLPALIFSMLFTYVIFDAFRQNSVAQKAAYTIGDMLSRETDYITPVYMDHSRSMLQYLTDNMNRDVQLRVSVLIWDDKKSKYKVKWSKNPVGRYSRCTTGTCVQ